MESSMFTRMMTASPGLCDLAKEWSVLDKISEWLGLLVYVQPAILVLCLGICRLERNGSQNWFWCLSCNYSRPCFCPQPHGLEVMSESMDKHRNWPSVPPLSCSVHCGFFPKALASCVSVP